MGTVLVAAQKGGLPARRRSSRIVSSSSAAESLGEYGGIYFAMQAEETSLKVRYMLDPWKREKLQEEF